MTLRNSPNYLLTPVEMEGFVDCKTFLELKQQNTFIDLSRLTKLDSYMFTLGL